MTNTKASLMTFSPISEKLFYLNSKGCLFSFENNEIEQLSVEKDIIYQNIGFFLIFFNNYNNLILLKIIYSFFYVFF